MKNETLIKNLRSENEILLKKYYLLLIKLFYKYRNYSAISKIKEIYESRKISQ